MRGRDGSLGRVGWRPKNENMNLRLVIFWLQVSFLDVFNFGVHGCVGWANFHGG